MNDCLIHAINYYAEAPVYRNRESFMRIYIRRKKNHGQCVREDVALRGIGIINLHCILYDPDRNKFLSPHSWGAVMCNSIATYIKKGYPIYELFEDRIKFERAILLIVDLPESKDPTDNDAERDYHAACARKVNGMWYILDSAEDKPINLHVWLDAANWAKHIEYMEIYELLDDTFGDKLIHKEKVHEWFRIVKDQDFSDVQKRKKSWGRKEEEDKAFKLYRDQSRRPSESKFTGQLIGN